jgi:hypothetical protein
MTGCRAKTRGVRDFRQGPAKPPKMVSAVPLGRAQAPEPLPPTPGSGVHPAAQAVAGLVQHLVRFCMQGFSAYILLCWATIFNDFFSQQESFAAESLEFKGLRASPPLISYMPGTGSANTVVLACCVLVPFTIAGAQARGKCSGAADLKFHRTGTRRAPIFRLGGSCIAQLPPAASWRPGRFAAGPPGWALCQ